MARLHEAQIDVPDSLARRLVDTQFPQWAGLPLTRIPSDGTIHHVYRLGEDLVVRLPFIDWAVEDVDRDAERLPQLARALPIDVPTLVGAGVPAPGMPWRWGVYSWIAGEHLSPGEEGSAIVASLADAVLALRAMSPFGPPSPAALDARADDERTRPRVEALRSPAALAAWDAAVTLGPNPASPSGWVHGDLMPGNIIVVGRQVHGILDWGASGLGDPAIDLLAAWTCMVPAQRRLYLELLSATPDDVTRARAIAVRKAAWGLPYYRDTNPGFVKVLEFTLAQVEAESD